MHHRLLHILQPSELKHIHPRRHLRSYVAASPLDIAERSEVMNPETGNLMPCGTYFWGSLLRIDVYQAPEDVCFVFFGTGAMQVYACTLLGEDDFVSLDESVSASVPPLDTWCAVTDLHACICECFSNSFALSDSTLMNCRALHCEYQASRAATVQRQGSAVQLSLSLRVAECCAGRSHHNGSDVAFAGHSVAARGGLRMMRDVELQSVGYVTTIADICVSGLPGWVAVVGGSGTEVLRMRVWAPKGVEVYVRPPIPCPTPVGIDQIDTF
jgi:hypothetical protein